MKCLKSIISYICIFIITLSFLFIALVLSSKIPRSAVEDNLKESIDFYKQNSGIHRIKDKHIYSYIHYFADTRKLNILYCIDSEKPLESTLWSKYYQVLKSDSNTDFINLVENSRTPNTQYLRYWNGCMLFLRPLLTFLNMEQIYLLNKILLSILALILFMILFKKSKKIAFIFLFALVLVSSWYVPFCIEYSVTFYVMIITSMIALKIDNSKKDNYTKEKANSRLLKLFLITGIVTCFFDFLTTEILTIFIPLMFILLIRKEENRLENLKDVLKFVFKACILWFIGYGGTWLAKWLLASLVLNINAFEYVKDNVALRINGLQGLDSTSELYCNVLDRNIFTIPLMYFIRLNIGNPVVKLAIVLFIFFIIIFINWKKFKEDKFLLFIFFIGFIPYIRYLVLANHSYRHIMFTFRDQIITIMSFSYIIIECFKYELLFKQVKLPKMFKRKRKEEK